MMTTQYGEGLARKIAAQIIVRHQLPGPPRNNFEEERYYQLVRAEIAKKAAYTLRMIVNGKDDHVTYWELAYEVVPVMVEEMRKIFMDGVKAS